jgi:hypothetical protein
MTRVVGSPAGSSSTTRRAASRPWRGPDPRRCRARSVVSRCPLETQRAP